MGEEEKAAVQRVMESGILAHGPEVVSFEEEFAEFCRVKNGAAASSGTSAIHLALAALGIGPGDEVITTSFSFIASATPILFLGATPRFVDIDPKTFNMDPEKLAEAVNDRTKAVIPVHLYGQCCDMDRIIEVSGDIPVLEDCAQAHGSIYKGKKAGSIGYAGMFSFYPTKNMTTGEGGMVVSDNEEFIEKVRMLRNHGQIERYDHHSIGYNLRLTSIGAAIGREQLKKLPANNEKRQMNATRLSKGLSDVPWVTPPFVEEWNRPVFHQYTIKVDGSRDYVSRKLNEKGIGNKVFYPTTIPSSPAMEQYSDQSFPVAEKICREVLSLPVHPMVSEEDIGYIIDTFKEMY
jgi:perosamine synthetase